MSREASMRKTVIAELRSLHAISVENGVGVGTPDVNYTRGWIELKSLPKWPAKQETDIRIEHFSPEQRLWILERVTHGGTVFLLLKVARDWLLFTGTVAAQFVYFGRTQSELRQRAIWSSSHIQGLCECLKKI